ncbi:head-tail connector protein [Filomicrobium sp.]|uniref:head-tail connector protein n=1 Tax=Filomicrobium sp. TaxID=2024831 RepID=UPI00258DE922|nr:head-tail connector protein [Filomicrobium sp.]MCV0371079.1 head-tail connector protein [Filomicrobium sp.]
MLRPVLVTPPVVAPVSLAEAKVHLRVDFDDDDTLIAALIDAAVAHLDGWTGVLGRPMINQDWRQDYIDWPASGFLRLPFPNVSSAALTYFDPDNVGQTVDTALYELIEDARSSVIRVKDGFPCPAVNNDRADAVQVTMTVGYGAAAGDVPAAIRAAMLLIVGHLYEHRESVAESSLAELPFGAMALIAPYRRIGV